MDDKKIHRLNVVTPAEEIRVETIMILKEALVAAENGEIDECVLIVRDHTDGFHELISPTQHFCDWIGKLEVIKANWIRHYSNHNRTDD